MFAAYTPYLLGILRGRVRPHPFSWLIWSLNSTLIFALQWMHGGGIGSLTTATVATASVAVFVLAVSGDRGRNRLRFSKADFVFFSFAVIAALLWLIAEEPLWSMTLLVLSDLLGLVPSIRKAWQAPREEDLSQWSVNALRHLLAIGALQAYSFVTLLNPVVWFFADSLVALLLLLRASRVR